MMINKKKREKFLANVEDDGGKWLKKARYRRENRGWLRKSQMIAIKVLSTLSEKEMQQKELAKALDVSPQQVSKIVKGKENLTLQTISKLENVLDISLFEIPRHTYKMEVSVKKADKANYKKKSGRQYATEEPLKTVVNGSWKPSEQNKSKLSLVNA